MSFNNPVVGLGTTVSYATSEGGSYTAVTQLKAVDEVAQEVAMWESTGLGSTVNEQVPTIRKASDFGFRVIYDPANTTHVALSGYLASKTLLYWKITLNPAIGPGAASAPSPAKTIAFAGYVNKFAVSGFESESGLEAAVGVGVTGGYTYA